MSLIKIKKKNIHAQFNAYVYVYNAFIKNIRFEYNNYYFNVFMALS